MTLDEQIKFLKDFAKVLATYKEINLILPFISTFDDIGLKIEIQTDTQKNRITFKLLGYPDAANDIDNIKHAQSLLNDLPFNLSLKYDDGKSISAQFDSSQIDKLIKSINEKITDLQFLSILTADAISNELFADNYYKSLEEFRSHLTNSINQQQNGEFDDYLVKIATEGHLNNSYFKTELFEIQKQRCQEEKSQYSLLEWVCYLNIPLENIKDINLPYDARQIPLNKAILMGNIELVQYFINHLKLAGNFDINKLHNGENPLHVAVKNQQLDMAKYLVDECGANVNVMVPTLLLKQGVEEDAASSSSHQPVQQINEEAGMTPLHLVARTGDAEMAKWLLENGAHHLATVNVKGWTPFSGWTPALLAIYHGNINIANELFKMKPGETRDNDFIMQLLGKKDNSFDDEKGFNFIDRCVLFDKDPVEKIKKILPHLHPELLDKLFKSTPYSQLNQGWIQTENTFESIKLYYDQNCRPRRVSGTKQWSELIHNNVNTGFSDNEREEAEQTLQNIVNQHLCFLPVLKYFANAKVDEFTEKQWTIFKKIIDGRYGDWCDQTKKSEAMSSIKNECKARGGISSTLGLTSTKHKEFIECIEVLAEHFGEGSKKRAKGLADRFRQNNELNAEITKDLMYFRDNVQSGEVSVPEAGPSS